MSLNFCISYSDCLSTRARAKARAPAQRPLDEHPAKAGAPMQGALCCSAAQRVRWQPICAAVRLWNNNLASSFGLPTKNVH